MRKKAIDFLREQPQGLFQTNLRVGLLFPIMFNSTFSSVPMLLFISTFNDVRGEIRALELIKDKDFVTWAVDPWTGKRNVDISRTL